MSHVAVSAAAMSATDGAASVRSSFSAAKTPSAGAPPSACARVMIVWVAPASAGESGDRTSITRACSSPASDVTSPGGASTMTLPLAASFATSAVVFGLSEVMRYGSEAKARASASASAVAALSPASRASVTGVPSRPKR